MGNIYSFKTSKFPNLETCWFVLNFKVNRKEKKEVGIVKSFHYWPTDLYLCIFLQTTLMATKNFQKRNFTDFIIYAHRLLEYSLFMSFMWRFYITEITFGWEEMKMKFAILQPISQNGWYYYRFYVQFMFHQFGMIDTSACSALVRKESPL